MKLLPTIAVSFAFCCTVLALGANHMTQKNNNPADDHRVILSLTTESSAIKKGEPFFVTLTIKNLSGKEFSFQTRRETLLDGEEISVRLNLSKLDWGHSILSAYPSDSVFPTVSGGRYILSFEFEAREGKELQKLKSNELCIQVLSREILAPRSHHLREIFPPNDGWQLRVNNHAINKDLYFLVAL